MNWIRGPTLGRGSSAAVTLATDGLSGEVFAVKSAELSRSEFLQREQKLLSTLKCPQIVAYKGCDTSLENGELVYNLFMECAPGGSLADVIRGGGRLDEVAIGSHARQILLGLEYLHSSGIVHCDIKGQNILVAEGGVKIADFGCAKRVVSDADSPIAGTPVYMAPEVARGEQQGFAADIWALGCTVIEMATGRAPWADVSDPVSALYRIGFSGQVPEIPTSMGSQGRDFLEKCLMKVPAERWSAKELLKHPFVAEKPEFHLINGFNSETPTGVLDQAGLWDSVERSETPTQLMDSPAERIRRLSGGGAADWEWDENWVRVRSNGMDEEVEKLKMDGTERVVEEETSEEDKSIFVLIAGNGHGSVRSSCESNVFVRRRRQGNKGTFVFVASKCTKQNLTCTNLNFCMNIYKNLGFVVQFHIFDPFFSFQILNNGICKYKCSWPIKQMSEELAQIFVQIDNKYLTQAR